MTKKRRSVVVSFSFVCKRPSPRCADIDVLHQQQLDSICRISSQMELAVQTKSQSMTKMSSYVILQANHTHPSPAAQREVIHQQQRSAHHQACRPNAKNGTHTGAPTCFCSATPTRLLCAKILTNAQQNALSSSLLDLETSMLFQVVRLQGTLTEPLRRANTLAADRASLRLQLVHKKMTSSRYPSASSSSADQQRLVCLGKRRVALLLQRDPHLASCTQLAQMPQPATTHVTGLFYRVSRDASTSRFLYSLVVRGAQTKPHFIIKSGYGRYR